MSMRSEKIPKKYHEAVVRWRDTYLPDYQLLIDNWDRFFPRIPSSSCALSARWGCARRSSVAIARASPRRPAPRARRQPGRSSARCHPCPGLDRVRLDPAAPADPRPGPGGAGPVLGHADDGRGASPRLSDAAPAAREDWSSVSDTRAPTWSKRSSRCAPARTSGCLQRRLRLLRRQHHFLLPDRPGRQVPARHAEGQRLQADGREHAADAARGGLPSRHRRRADAALGRAGGAGLVFITMETCRRRSTSGCRAASRCSATSAAAAPTSLRAQADEERRGAAGVLRGGRKVIDDLNMRFIRARLPELGPKQAEAVRRKVVDEGETEHGIRRRICCACPQGVLPPSRRAGVPLGRCRRRPYEDLDATSST